MESALDRGGIGAEVASTHGWILTALSAGAGSLHPFSVPSQHPTIGWRSPPVGAFQPSACGIRHPRMVFRGGASRQTACCHCRAANRHRQPAHQGRGAPETAPEWRPNAVIRSAPLDARHLADVWFVPSALFSFADGPRQPRTFFAHHLCPEQKLEQSPDCHPRRPQPS